MDDWINGWMICWQYYLDNQRSRLWVMVGTTMNGKISSFWSQVKANTGILISEYDQDHERIFYKNANIRVLPLSAVVLKNIPWTSRISITWEMVNMQMPWSHPKPAQSEPLGAESRNLLLINLIFFPLATNNHTHRKAESTASKLPFSWNTWKQTWPAAPSPSKL